MKIHYHIQKSPPLVLILSQMYAVQFPSLNKTENKHMMKIPCLISTSEQIKSCCFNSCKQSAVLWNWVVFQHFLSIRSCASIIILVTIFYK